MDKPILFSSPMILAILREIEVPGTGKTQTRRIIKPQPSVHENGSWSWEGRNGGFVGACGTNVDEGFPQSAAHWLRIQPCDRLWCREAHYLTDSGHELYAVYAEDSASVAEHLDAIRQMRADLKLSDAWAAPHLKRRPSIHMPRWASRLTLYVGEVRVEKLQGISEEDARAEGCPARGGEDGLDPRGWYADLWDSLNGPGAWDENPWVYAISFVPKLGNIDSLPASVEVAA